MELYKTLLNLGYERRKSQEKMFSIVEEFINKEYLDDEEQNVVLIEAPTGSWQKLWIFTAYHRAW
jgi:hypothetical protein